MKDFDMEIPSKVESWEKKIWEDNINNELKKIACEDGIWMELVRDPKQWQPLISKCQYTLNNR
jgi:hypothetical protein